MTFLCIQVAQHGSCDQLYFMLSKQVSFSQCLKIELTSQPMKHWVNGSLRMVSSDHMRWESNLLNKGLKFDNNMPRDMFRTGCVSETKSYLRRRPSINPALAQRLVFAAMLSCLWAILQDLVVSSVEPRICCRKCMA